VQVRAAGIQHSLFTETKRTRQALWRKRHGREKNQHRLRCRLTPCGLCANRAARLLELEALYETSCWMGARFDHFDR
jgi:hypothetical protein